MNIPSILASLWPKRPSPLAHAVRDLEAAQHDLLGVSSQAEYYNALEAMLEERIVRLQLAVRTLSEPREPS